MAYEDAVAAAPGGPRTTSGTGPTFGVPAGARVAIALIVTAVSGTGPSMTVSVQWSHDAGTTWSDADPADVFPAVTATGNRVKEFARKGGHARLAWTISGTTPSFTFSATAAVAGS